MDQEIMWLSVLLPALWTLGLSIIVYEIAD